MANKKITDLQLISAITDSLNFPSDDTIQSYRATASQFWTYLQTKLTGATGDLPYGSSSSAISKLAISTDLQKVLRPVSGVPAWAFLLGVQSSQTTTYAISATNDMLVFLNASGGAFTATLPTAASVAGKVYVLKKTGTDLNIVTIATTSSQTIDGVIGTTLNTPNETLMIVSDGSNWQILERRIPSVWTAYTMTIGATTTAPTKATTRLTDQAYWRRVADSMEITYNISWSSNSGANAGSGTYLFPLPTGAIDTAKIAVSGTETAVGFARAADGSNKFIGQAIVYNTTNFLLSGKYSAPGTTSSLTDIAIGSTGFNLANSGSTYINFQARVPISGWNG